MSSERDKKQPAYARELAQVLTEECSSSFSCVIKATHAPPKVKVEGLGELKLPLQPAAAASLKALCEQAPFGRGEATVVDTRVRRTWQLGTDNFNVTHPKLGDVVDSVCRELGVRDSSRVEAQLYKLLLYEPGSFFAPHKDTEKAPGMFATLVVQLPSVFKGGELVVRHNGQQQTYGAKDLGAHNSRLSYVAFYADCEHEVKPVTQGHRLCLIYNLCLVGSSPRQQLPTGPETVPRLVRLVRRWEADPQGPTFLVYMLEHRYTEHGRKGLASLKGNDLARAQLLQRMCEETGAGLALVRARCHESGDGGDDDFMFEDMWWSEDSEDEEVDSDPAQIYDIDYSIDSWCMLSGSAAVEHMGRTIIQREEMLPPDVFEHLKADREECTGPTGNEGAPLDRWYHHAALVLWPGPNKYCVMARSRGGPKGLISQLAKRTTALLRQYGGNKAGQQNRTQQQGTQQGAQQGEQQGAVQLPADAEAELAALYKGVMLALQPNEYDKLEDDHHNMWDHDSSESSGEGPGPRKQVMEQVPVSVLLPALKGLLALGQTDRVGELLLASVKRWSIDKQVLQLGLFLQQQCVPVVGWDTMTSWLKQMVSLDKQGHLDGPFCMPQLLLTLLGLQPLKTTAAPSVPQPGKLRYKAADTAAAKAAAAAVAAATAGLLKGQSCREQVQHVAQLPAETVEAVRAVACHLATAYYPQKTGYYRCEWSKNAVQGFLATLQLLAVLDMVPEQKKVLHALKIPAGGLRHSSSSGSGSGSSAQDVAAGRRRSARLQEAAANKPAAEKQATESVGAAGRPAKVVPDHDKLLDVIEFGPFVLSLGAWVTAAAAADGSSASSSAAVARTCSAAAGLYGVVSAYCCSMLAAELEKGPPDADPFRGSPWMIEHAMETYTAVKALQEALAAQHQALQRVPTAAAAAAAAGGGGSGGAGRPASRGVKRSAGRGDECGGRKRARG